MTRLVLHLLGAPRLERDGQRVAIDTRKALALLAYLAVTGQRQGRDTLAALLWPDYADGRAVLRRTLSSLGQALGGIGLVVDRDSIGLVPAADLWIDLLHFRARLLASRQHAHDPAHPCAECLAWLEEAVGLYQDDFMAGFNLRDSPEFDDWRFFQAEGLRRELAGALDRLVEAQTQQGAYEAAISHARRRLALDPLHEPAHRALMQLFEWAGQRTAALRQFQRCQRTLKDELGVAPAADTVTLYQAIRSGSGPPPPPIGPHQPAIDERPTTSASAGGDQRLAAGGHRLPLLGRAAEWARLEEDHAGIGPDGRLIVIEGEAGIGKSRLVEEWLAVGAPHQAAHLVSRCYAGQSSLAYAPLAECLREALRRPDAAQRLAVVAAHWLAEAARLLPELRTLAPDLPPTAPLESLGAQTRFFEGMAQVISALVRGDRPGVVVIDDLHWADAATLDLVAYLSRRLAARPLALIVTWRTEETSADHRLRLLLAETLRAGDGRHLTLTRLSRRDLAPLASPSGPAGALPAALVERICAEAEGLPFFLVEYLTSIDQAPPRTADDAAWAPPQGVQALLSSRLALVDQAGRQLLATAAVIGRSFDIDTLQAVVGGVEETTVTTLEALLARGLIREAGGEGPPLYDFSHERLRAFVSAQTSQARRRLLHRRVAQSLLLYDAGAVTGPLAGRIAHHFEQAGQPATAARHYRQAGAYARALYANAEALAHYRAALSLGDPDVSGLQEAIGDLQTLMGDYGPAIASYTAAYDVAEPTGRARLDRKLGGVHHRRGALGQAETHYTTAMTAYAAAGAPEAHASADAAAGETIEQARLLADWSLTARQQGDETRAVSLAERALSLAAAVADTRALAQSHNVLGILASGRGDLPVARHHLEHSLTLATTLNDPGAQVAALNNLALVASVAGRAADARSLAETALSLCLAQGDRHRAAALHSRLADLLHAAGQLEPAMAHLKQAVRIFAEIGVEAGAVQPSIWRLTEW